MGYNAFGVTLSFDRVEASSPGSLIFDIVEEFRALLCRLGIKLLNGSVLDGWERSFAGAQDDGRGCVLAVGPHAPRDVMGCEWRDGVRAGSTGKAKLAPPVWLRLCCDGLWGLTPLA